MSAIMSAGAQISSSKLPPKYACNNQPFTVFIEGNIGSGKTTFLNHFRQFEDQICLITEPVDKWRNVHGSNILVKQILTRNLPFNWNYYVKSLQDLMYKEPDRWAMPFQTYVTLTMLQTHVQATNKPIKIMERSIFSSR